MLHETPLSDSHIQAGGKLVDFHGWNLPLHYGSQITEHHAVRQAVGMFDVSHMTVIDVQGTGAQDFLRYLLANDVAKLSDGRVLYSAMLNEVGGVVDDLTVYCLESAYRLVVNCATREKVLIWMTNWAKNYDVHIQERLDLAMIAVQGPKAMEVVQKVLGEERHALTALSRFSGIGLEGARANWYIATTGYTGEEGCEIMLPSSDIAELWRLLLLAGVQPCGLGARDTLRLEAGMNLYGNEMDESISPLQANMGWTVAWKPQERIFIGREALESEKSAGSSQKLVGLIYKGKGVLRAGQRVVGGQGEGTITSGSFSPTLDCSIALARVPQDTMGELKVEIRKKWGVVEMANTVFVRNGKKLV